MLDQKISHANELPRGTSNFKKMVEEARSGGLQLVDKTPFVEQIVKSSEEVMLFTRPRRFGKSTNLSMLYYFLSSEKAQENRSLFTGLKIESHPDVMAEQGAYPVIMINLKELKSSSSQEYIPHWLEFLSDLYSTWQLPLKEFLTRPENSHFSQNFNEVLNKKSTRIQIQKALQRLTQYIAQATGHKPWILIDEYDSAIYHAFSRGFHQEALDILSPFLSNALKDNEYLHKGVLTGILRVVKESIFSGLNNIGVYSFQTPYYADAFGFTAQEVRHLIMQRPCLMDSHEEEFNALSSWYNGYECGGVTLYNPWSIVSYMTLHKFSSYWVQTASDEILRTLFSKGGHEVTQPLSQLLLTGEVKALFSEVLDFNSLEEDPSQIWGIMVASGYLKIVNPDLLPDEEVTLVAPNYEVARALKTLATSILSSSGPVSSFTQGLKKLISGDPILFIEALQKIFKNNISFHDLSHGGENFAHGVILGVIGGLNDAFLVRSNRESGEGRYDIAVFPHAQSPNKRGILIELKMSRELYEDEEMRLPLRLQQLRLLSEKAIEQILSKNYVEEFRAQGANEVLLIGLAFGGKCLEGSYRHLDLNTPS